MPAALLQLIIMEVDSIAVSRGLVVPTSPMNHRLFKIVVITGI